MTFDYAGFSHKILPVGEASDDGPLTPDEIRALRSLKALLRDVPGEAAAIVHDMPKKDRAVLGYYLYELSAMIDEQQLRDRSF